MQNNNKNFVRDNMYEGSRPAIYAKPFFYAIITIALISMAVYLFINIQKQEAVGVVKLRGIAQGIYELGGKWLVVAFILFAAAVMGYRTLYFWKGIKKGLKKKYVKMIK